MTRRQGQLFNNCNTATPLKIGVLILFQLPQTNIAPPHHSKIIRNKSRLHKGSQPIQSSSNFKISKLFLDIKTYLRRKFLIIIVMIVNRKKFTFHIFIGNVPKGFICSMYPKNKRRGHIFLQIAIALFHKRSSGRRVNYR